MHLPRKIVERNARVELAPRLVVRLGPFELCLVDGDDRVRAFDERTLLGAVRVVRACRAGRLHVVEAVLVGLVRRFVVRAFVRLVLQVILRRLALRLLDVRVVGAVGLVR
eukprot:6171875-Pleurochrysis_carterae.AAC.1